MTTPQVGFPDFQQYPLWRGNVNPNVTRTISPAAPAIIDMQVANFASMFFKVVGIGQGVIAQVTYYQDSTKAVSEGAYYWEVRSPNYLSVVIPNLGNFAEISVSTAIAGNQGVTIIAQPCNTPVAKPFYPEQQNLLAKPDNVAASTTNFYNMPQVVEGSGVFIYIPGDSSGKLDVSMFETGHNNSFRNNLLTYTGPVANIVQPFQTSVYPITISVHNNDAVTGHPFTLRVQSQSI